MPPLKRDKMERKTGFEPATLALARRCSTPEPLPLIMAGEAGFEPAHHGVKVRCLTTWLLPKIQMLWGDRWESNP
jgi:hypothetical protein